MFTATHTALGQVFATILAALGARLGLHAGTIRPTTAPAVALLSLAYWRLVRLTRRLDRLVLRWQQGLPLAPRRATAKPRAPRPPTPRPQSPRLPRGHAWLIRLHQPAAQHAGQVAAFLDRPETRALIAAAPQAGRLLRPLCRMLGVALPDTLALPARPRRRRHTPPAAPGTPDRPLPARIRAAARAWRTARD